MNQSLLFHEYLYQQAEFIHGNSRIYDFNLFLKCIFHNILDFMVIQFLNVLDAYRVCYVQLYISSPFVVFYVFLARFKSYRRKEKITYVIRVKIFLCLSCFYIHRPTLYDNVLVITNLSTNSLNELLRILLFGNKSLSYETNCQIFKAVQCYIKGVKEVRSLFYMMPKIFLYAIVFLSSSILITRQSTFVFKDIFDSVWHGMN